MPNDLLFITIHEETDKKTILLGTYYIIIPTVAARGYYILLITRSDVIYR